MRILTSIFPHLNIIDYNAIVYKVQCSAKMKRNTKMQCKKSAMQLKNSMPGKMEKLQSKVIRIFFPLTNFAQYFLQYYWNFNFARNSESAAHFLNEN